MKFMSRAGFEKPQSNSVAPMVALGSPFKEHSPTALRMIRADCERSWHDPDFGRAERDAYHAQTEGTLPQAAGADILVLSCDPGYFNRFGTNFIASHDAAEDASAIHIHLTLPDDPSIQILEKIQNHFGPKKFSFTFSKSEIPRYLKYNGVYLTCARFIHTHKLMTMHQGRCVNIDIDSIVRAPIQSFVNATLQDKDIAYIRRWSRLKTSRKVLASALIQAQSDFGLRFSDALSRCLVQILLKGPQYHIDQTVLYYLTRTAQRSGLKAATMGLDLADHHFKATSPVWSAKGRKRKQNLAFLQAAEDADRKFKKILAKSDP